jgi:2-polyprenyl-3-methyl-5-hydroxy-6-metoxy-1,4-benzoquinol methylase
LRIPFGNSDMNKPPVPGNPTLTRRPCPVCNDRQARFVHSMFFVLPETSPLPARYDVVICDQCDTGFADSGATAEDYAEYYRSFSKYEDAAVATGGGDDPADRRRLSEVAAFLAARVRPGGRILDVGCGNGGLLAALRAHGFPDLTGFDPSAACTARVQQNGMQGVVRTLPLTDPTAESNHWGRFDLIILSHVLEHVFDARAVLESLLPLLAPEGLLYLETPDPLRYSTDGFPPLYFFDAEHINHLGLRSLATLAITQGLHARALGEKDLLLANGLAYPAVSGLFQRGGAAMQVPALRPAHTAFQRYVDASLTDLERLRARVLDLLGDGRPFALWGAGSLSQRLLSAPWFPRQQLCAVVDRDSRKHGLRFTGVTVSPPEQGLQDLPADALVICAAAIAAGVIEQDYRALGLPYAFHSLAV